MRDEDHDLRESRKSKQDVETSMRRKVERGGWGKGTGIAKDRIPVCAEETALC